MRLEKNTSSSATCPVCKASCAGDSIRGYRSRGTSLFQSLTVTVCKSCDLVFAWPRLAEDAIQTYYIEGGYDAVHPGTGNLTNVWSMGNVRAAGQVGFIRRVTGSLVGKNIVDIGSAEGHLISTLKKSGANKVIGVEPSNIRRNASIKIGDDIECSEKNVPESEKYSIVTCSHVLEHVTDPTQFLFSLRHLLENDGIVFIEIPVEHTPAMSRVDEPHLQFFSIKAFAECARKAAYEVVTLEEHGPFIRSIIVNRVGHLLKTIVRTLNPNASKRIIAKIHPGYWGPGKNRVWLRAILKPTS